MNFNEREKRLFNILDWAIVLVAIISLPVLVVLYFYTRNIPNLSNDVREFTQSIITNLVPIPFLFVLSYLTFRRIQTIRDERDRDLLADKLALSVSEKIALREGRQVLLDTPPQERGKRLQTAKDIYLVGVSLNTTVHKYFAILRSRLQEGSTIRVLLMEPKTGCVELVAQRKNDNTDPEVMSHYIEITLSTLCGLRKDFPDHLHIHTINYPLSFGAIAADMDSHKGTIYLEHYSFKTEQDGLHLKLDVQDEPWYDRYRAQIKELWSFSKEWTC